LLTNKKAIRYQIIGVISDDDIRKYSKYNKNIQELIINGLSIKRIIGISWYINKVLGKK
jgi:hypothetical protein